MPVYDLRAALLTALCKDNGKRGQLQHWLSRSDCPDEPEDYAAHFDRLYHIRCGELCVCTYADSYYELRCTFNPKLYVALTKTYKAAW